MAFDSEILGTERFALAQRRPAPGAMISAASDPDPCLAESDPARLTAFLFVSPRPCAAFDALIARASARVSD